MNGVNTMGQILAAAAPAGFYIHFGSGKITKLQKVGIIMTMKAQDYYVREEGVLVKVTQLVCLPVWF